METMSPFSQLSIVIPDTSILAIFDVLLMAQQALEQDGVTCKIMLKRGVSIDGKALLTKARTAIPVAGETVEEVGEVAHRPTARRKKPAQRRRGQNAVKYRVINPSIRMGQVPHDIRMFILTHGPTTAREIEEKTGAGRKSVESALYGLRAAGSVESVPDTGQAITQRKFSKTRIAAGAPA